MKRRDFLQNALLGLPLLMFSQRLLTSCELESNEKNGNGKRVVVVGGGIAGLAAAKKLQSKGFSVVLLEANSKVGGRISTNRSLEIPFDEGASWIHGPNGNPITELAQKAGAETFLTNDDLVSVFDVSGERYSDLLLESAENQFNDALEQVTALGAENQSFKTVFDTLYPNLTADRLWNYFLSAYLEFNTGADIAQLSSKYFYDDDEFAGADVIITNGFDRITNFLSEGLDIRLNSRVQIIDYTLAKSVVATATEIFEADYVLVTVPLGVLKSNVLNFAPPLPQTKLQAIADLQMGLVNKFLLKWDQAFWNTDLQFIGYTPEEKGKFNYFLNVTKYSSTPALITFTYGSYAAVSESLSDAEVISEIMTHLRKIYGESIPNPTNLLRTKWGQNPNAYGSYSFVPNNSDSEAYDTLSKSVENRLFFAGEHTHRAYRGSVHGAYLSGIREANRILNLQ
ncbi:FAD-dependent oxidoreductase [Flavobacterium sp.]|uniref:FAD-dependent oxidoreductase n=1 Tax=Flavobacterium sp. TaxID=239 RepID=UPI00260604B5|nr:FAD-dependent oxidoreductase [Flavobacterium sp.]